MSCFLPPENQTLVREAFMAINSSDSGEISLEELSAALPDYSEDQVKEIIANVCQE